MSFDRIFCPDVGDYCIGESCIAHTNNMVIEVKSGNPFVKKVNNKLSYDLPIAFSLEVDGCSKYDKIVDEESLILLEEFKRDVNQEDKDNVE